MTQPKLTDFISKNGKYTRPLCKLVPLFEPFSYGAVDADNTTLQKRLRFVQVHCSESDVLYNDGPIGAQFSSRRDAIRLGGARQDTIFEFFFKIHIHSANRPLTLCNFEIHHLCKHYINCDASTIFRIFCFERYNLERVLSHLHYIQSLIILPKNSNCND